MIKNKDGNIVLTSEELKVYLETIEKLSYLTTHECVNKQQTITVMEPRSHIEIKPDGTIVIDRM